MLGRHVVTMTEVVAESVRVRLEHGERFHVGLLLRCIGAPRREGHLHIMSGVLCRLFDRSAPAEHDEIGQRDTLPARLP